MSPELIPRQSVFACGLKQWSCFRVITANCDDLRLFYFFNELDLLEIRLNTLSDVVDRFVIAEATRTYSGKHKELVFAGNRQRFAAFADRIDYIVVEDLLDTQTIARDPYNLPWVNENRQRNALMRVVANAKPTDIVMVSDLDEIPRPEEVAKIDTRLNDKVATVRFEMEFFNYYLNFKDRKSVV